MAIRKFRFDSLRIRTESPRAPAPREDREPVRLRTSITFARTTSRIHGFRVVAERVEGPAALVCLGATRAEVLGVARALSAELPPDTVHLRLEEWLGGTCAGQWQRRPCQPGELPLPAGRRRLRRRRGRLRPDRV
jgi:hypothetical protein